MIFINIYYIYYILYICDESDKVSTWPCFLTFRSCFGQSRPSAGAPRPVWMHRIPTRVRLVPSDFRETVPWMNPRKWSPTISGWRVSSWIFGKMMNEVGCLYFLQISLIYNVLNIKKIPCSEFLPSLVKSSLHSVSPGLARLRAKESGHLFVCATNPLTVQSLPPWWGRMFVLPKWPSNSGINHKI